MFEEILSKNAKKSLVLLGQVDSIKKAYLAGGTGLALQLGHRFSFDFDFFTFEEFEAEVLVQLFQEVIPNFERERISWGTIYGYLKEGKTKKNRFSFLYYKYPLLFPTENYLEIKLAHPKDIGAMKIEAISGRGNKRDFIDLYFLCQEDILDLKEVLGLYDQKYGTLEQNRIHVLKSLTYFGDADKQKMPKMIKDIKWKEVKKFFEREVKSLI